MSMAIGRIQTRADVQYIVPETNYSATHHICSHFPCCYLSEQGDILTPGDPKVKKNTPKKMGWHMWQQHMTPKTGVWPGEATLWLLVWFSDMAAAPRDPQNPR